MNKKMLPVCVLKILEEYSDFSHPLHQRDIIRLLEENYQLVIARKALGNVLHELEELDYDIRYQNGFYLEERQFTKSELHFLIDSILSDGTLTARQMREMMEKLLVKESAHMRRSFTHVHTVSHVSHGENPEFFLSVELIDEAIEQNCKISFDYYSYGLDLKLHKRRERPYIVNPYEMMVSNGHYYLIGNYDAYDNISHYRMDKIRNVVILKEIRKPITQIPECRNGFAYPKHLLEHIYMFAGVSEHVKIKFENSIIDQIVDWFGNECRIEPVDADVSFLYVKVNRSALKYWLKQYDEFAEEVKEDSDNDGLQRK